MKRYIFLAFSIPIMLNANISGVVFKDLPVNANKLNSYGIKDSNEPGVKNIQVKAFDINNNEIDSTTTNKNGEFTLKTSSGAYRVEIHNIPSYLKISPNGTQVKFVKDGERVNFALHNPSDYSSTPNPPYITNRQSNGSGKNDNNASIVTISYKYKGLNREFYDAEGNIGEGEKPATNALISQVGSVWGKAYQKSKKRAFVSALLQRHVGFAKDEGAVFIIDYSNSTNNMDGVYSGYFSLQGKNTANGSTIDLGSVKRSGSSDYTLSDNPNEANIDLDAFSKVAKISFGDIDFDQINNKLWLVNLNQKALISVDANSDDLNSAEVNQYLLKDMPNLPMCNNGELRPWGLAIHNAKGYLGAVCDASISQDPNDLKAYILSFNLDDISAGFSKVLEFNLNSYNRPKSSYSWHPWSDIDKSSGGTWKHYAQPILTDIVFDEKDNIYIALNDRYGLQAGNENYPPISGTTSISEKTQSFGDILKVCNVDGNYVLEGNPNCPPSKIDYDGDGIYEFFNDSSGDESYEAIQGALAILPGRKELLASTVGPHPQSDFGKKYWTTQGYNRLSLENGEITNWYADIFTGYDASHNKSYEKYNGKASGLGDIEFITEAAPIEIGDRVWLDLNKNGIQDANEKGIANVKIELICNSNVVATVYSDKNGYYLFSNNPNGVNSDSKAYNIQDIKAKNLNNCYVKIPDVSGDNTQEALKYMGVTVSSDNDLINSDGVLEGNDLKASIDGNSIKIDGQNNYNIDFGFYIKNICIGSYAWYDKNLNGIADEDLSKYRVKDIKVYLYSENESLISETTTDESGKYQFCNIDPNRSYIVKFDIPKGYNATLKNKGENEELDSDANANGEIYIKSDDIMNNIKEFTKNGDKFFMNPTFNLGIYCSCDDAKVHPQNYKKLSLSSINIFSAIFLIITLLLLSKKD